MLCRTCAQTVETNQERTASFDQTNYQSRIVYRLDKISCPDPWLPERETVCREPLTTIRIRPEIQY